MISEITSIVHHTGYLIINKVVQSGCFGNNAYDVAYNIRFDRVYAIYLVVVSSSYGLEDVDMHTYAYAYA